MVVCKAEQLYVRKFEGVFSGIMSLNPPLSSRIPTVQSAQRSCPPRRGERAHLSRSQGQGRAQWRLWPPGGG